MRTADRALDWALDRPIKKAGDRIEPPKEARDRAGIGRLQEASLVSGISDDDVKQGCHAARRARLGSVVPTQVWLLTPEGSANARVRRARLERLSFASLVFSPYAVRTRVRSSSAASRICRISRANRPPQRSIECSVYWLAQCSLSARGSRGHGDTFNIILDMMLRHYTRVLVTTGLQLS